MKSLFIVGNWKSNKTIQETRQWLSEAHAESSQFKDHLSDMTVIICGAATVLGTLKQSMAEFQLPFSVGAQNVSMFDDGAYTGEVSARMLSEVVQWVIVGHSERRVHQQEADDQLSKKAQKAKEAGLRVIYCVPDAITMVPDAVDVIAYEPTWAIGTGKADTPENANEVCAQIKSRHNVPVLYGGSVTDENVASFVGKTHIDGVLAGGVSLDFAKFLRLLRAAAL